MLFEIEVMENRLLSHYQWLEISLVQTLCLPIEEEEKLALSICPLHPFYGKSQSTSGEKAINNLGVIYSLPAPNEKIKKEKIHYMRKH